MSKLWNAQHCGNRAEQAALAFVLKLRRLGRSRACRWDAGLARLGEVFLGIALAVEDSSACSLLPGI